MEGNRVEACCMLHAALKDYDSKRSAGLASAQSTWVQPI